MASCRQQENDICHPGSIERVSAETYVSSVPSLDDLSKESRIEVVPDRCRYPPDVIASNPSSFGKLFPSTRRLLVQHDATTIDGNMNLRVDTMVFERHRRQRRVILFHLRMHNLRDRKFSLRRYCRDSGREVCRSSMKYSPSFSRRDSLSTAFSNLRPHSEADSGIGSFRRLGSGFKSWAESESANQFRTSSEFLPEVATPAPTNTIQLDFSNYARVDIKRRGGRLFRHYDFEYWNTRYQWRESVQNYGGSLEISYHLYQSGRIKPIAHIVPERLTRLETAEEGRKGGWVPISSMWISEPSVFQRMSDVADVIVATGLTAMIDDCIQRKWHHNRSIQSAPPLLSPIAKSMDFLASMKLFSRLFFHVTTTGFRRSKSLYRTFDGG
ncbi:hypothetical protein VTO42DRAFT_1042 [Malbranchea cinnamomea]